MKLGDRDGAKLVFEIRLRRLSPARRTIYHFVYVLCSSGQPGAQRVSDLMIHTNEQFLWLEPLELETLLVFSCLQIPARN